MVVVVLVVLVLVVTSSIPKAVVLPPPPPTDACGGCGGDVPSAFRFFLFVSHSPFSLLSSSTLLSVVFRFFLLTFSFLLFGLTTGGGFDDGCCLTTSGGSDDGCCLTTGVGFVNPIFAR